MVHRREVGDQEIILGNQGALYGNAMTWWDHDTGSVWTQPRGEAILGPRKGERLELLPSTLTEWGSWTEAHPDTLALKAKSGIFRGGLSLDSTVIVVEIGETAIAYPYPDIIESGVINDVIEGLEIAVVVDPSDSGRWMVFSRRLSDRIVLLEIDGPLLVDSLTGEEIDPVRGLILTGPDAGEALGTVPAFTSFPRDFSTFFPQGQIWQNR